MSTTTGNIKISQLSQLSAIDNGDKLRIPVSRDKSATSTPDWESYSVSASVLSSFLEDSLGLGTAAYKNESDFDAAGAASTAAAGVEAKLPVVTNGSGITVTPTTDENGKTTYKISTSTSAEVFHYKGNKTALSELSSTGNTTGDVWSVGPADAVGSTLYAWDGDEWINIGGANGITGVDTTSSKGVALAKNTNGTVKVNVTPGSVASGNDSVVTGGAVYTAIAAAEGRCDANGTAQGLINALGGSASSSNGSYVNVTVNTSKGQVSGVTVSETDALKTAVSNANSAVQSVSVLGKTLDKTTNYLTVEEAKTALGLDDYINEKINSAGHIRSVSKKYKEILIDVNTSNKAVTINSTSSLINAATNANSALQRVSVLGKTLDKTTNELTVEEAKTALGLDDYINEKITSADHIHSVSKKSGETLIEVATENKNVTINSTSALTTAVSNANSAVQSVSVLGKTLNKTNNSITVAEAKKALGLGDLNNQGSKELEKELGKYDLVSEITFSEAVQGEYISTSGTKKTSSSYFISNEITLKQGNLYLLQVNYPDYNDDALPADMALMAKVDKLTYIGEYDMVFTVNVYEPLPNHYRTINNGGYGVPASHYFVFFATENMNVVISGNSTTISKTLYEVKYGVFNEAASKLLTINGDLMKVIVEAIVKNKKDIDSINENMKSLGDIHANSIDLDDFPSVQGEPMVVVANRRPSAAGTNHGDDVPNRIGQIWVDTTNKKAYIAVALGSTGDDSWKQITI